jgi:flavin-binding protein dodecin
MTVSNKKDEITKIKDALIHARDDIQLLLDWADEVDEQHRPVVEGVLIEIRDALKVIHTI